jgi:methyl-accepting chemotaxis protein/ABC-type sugar transport system substrate-binding protein
MRTINLRQVFFGASIVTGVISSVVIASGVRLLGNNSLHWLDILWIGGIFTLFFIIIQLLLLSFWVIPPLKWFVQIAKFSENKNLSFFPRPIWIRELHRLAYLLQSNLDYSNGLARIGHEVLERGGRQEIKPRSEADNMGKAFQQLMNTLGALEELVEEITRGNLTIHVPKELRETKIGQVFRVMVIEIRQSVMLFRKETRNVSDSSARVSAMSQQGSRNAAMETYAVENISSSTQQVAGNLQEAIQNIRLQVDSLDNMFTATEKMISSIQDINDGVELLSSLAESTAQSIHEIHEFTKEIEGHAQSSAQISETVATEAKDGLNSVGSVIEGIHTIKSTVEGAAEAIQRLGNESERIGEVLAVINDVAEQTNLLALNASIIAAQAGEHGRGFSVVADEIKELAERTRASTKEIAEIIQSVQNEVAQGMTAIQSCLQAVEEGVTLANQSGSVLKKIVRSIQGAKKMASTIASATVTQAENSQQVKDSTKQVTQKLEELYEIVKNQAQESAQIADVINFLKEITQLIDQSAITQLKETEAIVESIKEMQKLVHRNANMAHQLAESSNELGALKGNLAENLGRFFVTKQQLPANFDQNKPTIAFVRHGSDFFFEYIYEGIQNALPPEKFQSIAINSEGNPVKQAVNVNWLLQQPWLAGVILAPVDEHIGSHLVTDVMEHGAAIVIVDFMIEDAGVCVLSDNTRGGTYAAEILREALPDESVVIVFGSRNFNSLACRMNGFSEKAKLYQWTVMEIFSFVGDIKQAKKTVLEGLQLFPDAQGVFLTNETTVLAYLELIREEKIPKRTLHVVGFDMTTEIAEAIADGRLCGAIIQDPSQFGRVATQEILNLLQQNSETPHIPKEILVPVKKITKENVPSEFIT